MHVAVVVGTHPTGLSPGFFVARFLPKGAFDPSFGNGGTVQYPGDFFGSARTVTLQADDKIVVGGWVSSAPFPGAEIPAVVRLLRGLHGSLRPGRPIPSGRTLAVAGDVAPARYQVLAGQ